MVCSTACSGWQVCHFPCRLAFIFGLSLSCKCGRSQAFCLMRAAQSDALECDPLCQPYDKFRGFNKFGAANCMLRVDCFDDFLCQICLGRGHTIQHWALQASDLSQPSLLSLLHTEELRFHLGIPRYLFISLHTQARVSFGQNLWICSNCVQVQDRIALIQTNLRAPEKCNPNKSKNTLHTSSHISIVLFNGF